MPSPSSSDVRQHKIEKITNRDKVLTILTWANLLLMLNTGMTGLIKAGANINSQDHEPPTKIAMGTDTSTLVVSALFALLAISTNKAARCKKHQELTLAARELRDEVERVDADLEREIGRASKRALNVDKTLTYSSYLCIAIFLLTSVWSLVEKSQGRIANSAIPDGVGNSFYLLAMLITLGNKFLGDNWQKRLEKRFIAPYTEENGARQSTNSGLFQTITSHISHFIPQVQRQHSGELLPLVDERPSTSLNSNSLS